MTISFLKPPGAPLPQHFHWGHCALPDNIALQDRLIKLMDGQESIARADLLDTPHSRSKAHYHVYQNEHLVFLIFQEGAYACKAILAAKDGPRARLFWSMLYYRYKINLPKFIDILRSAFDDAASETMARAILDQPLFAKTKEEALRGTPLLSGYDLDGLPQKNSDAWFSMLSMLNNLARGVMAYHQRQPTFMMQVRYLHWTSFYGPHTPAPLTIKSNDHQLAQALDKSVQSIYTRYAPPEFHPAFFAHTQKAHNLPIALQHITPAASAHEHLENAFVQELLREAHEEAT